MIKIADIAGLNPISIAFTRVAVAGIVLFMVNRLTGSNIAKAVRETYVVTYPLSPYLTWALALPCSPFQWI